MAEDSGYELEPLREGAEFTVYRGRERGNQMLILAAAVATEQQRLCEQAIHEHGFIQNEGLAHELAAQYLLARGLEPADYAHLPYARNCYDRWGATAK
jgi:hypothetical protein